MSTEGARQSDHRWSRALLIVAAAAVVRLIFAAIIPVFPDEAYYWEWSRHLASGYFDHPPAIAMLIRIGGGANPLGVRLGSVLAGFIAAVATIRLARLIGGDRAALRAAIVITVLPLAAAGLILATPDSPLLATTAVSLYCVVRALESPVGSRLSLRWWITAGVALGLAFTSKYTSVFLPLAVVGALLLRPSLRARFREVGPYAACVVATLVFLPTLIWNAQHGWISFVYQLHHGLSAPRGSALLAAWRHEGDFFGGQAGLASPILFGMLAIATVRALTRRASDALFVLAMVALVSFGFFVYSALRQRVEPNWPAPAYIPAIALLAAASWTRVGERWFKAGVALAALMSAIIYGQALAPVLPIAAPKDPIGRAFGWRELVARADSAARTATLETRTATWLGGDRYQEAAELALWSPAHPTTFATNLSGRANQYDLWPRFTDVAHAGDNLLLVLDDSDELHAAVKALSPYFDEVRRGDRVLLQRGGATIGTRRLWLLVGWHSGWPAPR